MNTRSKIYLLDIVVITTKYSLAKILYTLSFILPQNIQLCSPYKQTYASFKTLYLKLILKLSAEFLFFLFLFFLLVEQQGSRSKFLWCFHLFDWLYAKWFKSFRVSNYFWTFPCELLPVVPRYISSSFPFWFLVLLHI